LINAKSYKQSSDCHVELLSVLHEQKLQIP
jgi:hypothetical protein